MGSGRPNAVVTVACASLAAALLAAPAPAAADHEPYSIFNPVPDDQMRDFATDRPTKSNVPYTVPAGHFQYETDLFNLSFQMSGSTGTEVFLFTNPTAKIGLTNNVDLEVNMAPFESVHTFDRAAGTSTMVAGPGDLYTRLKINLWGNDGGNSAFALIPYVKTPTAAPGIGNGAYEGGVIAPLSFSLSNGFTLLFNSEADSLKDSLDDGHHANFINLVNLSKQVIKDVTVYAELWSDVNRDPLNPVTQYSFDTAIEWIVRKNLQLDCGINFGLNRETPAVQFYVGMAQRF